MRQELVSVLGTSSVDNLIAKLAPTAETFGIKVKADHTHHTSRCVVNGKSIGNERHIIIVVIKIRLTPNTGVVF